MLRNHFSRKRAAEQAALYRATRGLSMIVSVDSRRDID
jgi:hypothetical protein